MLSKYIEIGLLNIGFLRYCFYFICLWENYNYNSIVDFLFFLVCKLKDLRGNRVVLFIFFSDFFSEIFML